jgi:hypothetical protein
VPKEYRPYIIINGKRTVEYDFDQLNPTMMYGFAKATCEGDAFDIGLDRKYRPIVKQAFNAMVQSLTGLNRKPKDIDLEDIGLSWLELRDRIVERNTPVRDQFFRGRGNELQFLDSQIAERILLHFAAKDIPCLPIHDSFIMHHGYYSELEEIMQKTFEKLLSVKCDISADERLPPFGLKVGETREVDTSLESLQEYADVGYKKRLNTYFTWRQTL